MRLNLKEIREQVKKRITTNVRGKSNTYYREMVNL